MADALPDTRLQHRESLCTMHSRRLCMIYRFDKRESVHLVQITDCHVHNERDRLLSGVNTYDSLAQVIDGINNCTQPVDMALVTGDLTHEGDERAYRLLLEQLDRLPVPFFWLAG